MTAEIHVVAAVIERGGRWLLGKRPAEKRHGGLWEFPGGKIGDGETLPDATDRELTEELGLRVHALGRTLHTAKDPDTPYVIHFVEVEADREPIAREHTELGWFNVEEMADLSLAPADAEFIATRV